MSSKTLTAGTHVIFPAGTQMVVKIDLGEGGIFVEQRTVRLVNDTAAVLKGDVDVSIDPGTLTTLASVEAEFAPGTRARDEVTGWVATTAGGSTNTIPAGTELTEVGAVDTPPPPVRAEKNYVPWILGGLGLLAFVGVIVLSRRKGE